MAKSRKNNTRNDIASGQRSLFPIEQTMTTPHPSENVAEKLGPDEQLLRRLNDMTIDELGGEIKRHNALYNAGTPEILDTTYDRLVQRFRDISPDQTIANVLTSPDVSDVSRGKVTHDIPMLSIQ